MSIWRGLCKKRVFIVKQHAIRSSMANIKSNVVVKWEKKSNIFNLKHAFSCINEFEILNQWVRFRVVSNPGQLMPSYLTNERAESEMQKWKTHAIRSRTSFRGEKQRDPLFNMFDKKVAETSRKWIDYHLCLKIHIWFGMDYIR
jgi:hypothetical protein